MSQYFPKKLRNSGGNINIKVGLLKYATKSDIKNISQVDAFVEVFVDTFWSFVLKTNLASLKTEIDKLDIENLVPALVDLSKLNNVVKNVVKNGVVKKAVYDKLVTKVINIDNSGFVVKLESELEEKLLSLLKKQITIIKLLK